ncbi:MAG: bifunctional transaldolase/phosoglucose isomerase, partial [bacterium]|nr:bifunctional transaldolase/phosoglucose isomerase [bacterium]
KAAEAFLSGLELRVERGEAIDSIASVASFFLSRIDSLVEKLIVEQSNQGNTEAKTLMSVLEGKVAISNAKLTYKYFKDLYSSERFQILAKKGAQKQRLLWASTSTKNPKFPEVYYVEELIGAETVNTIPPATFAAFRKEGKVADTLEANVADAQVVMDNLAKIGISFKAVTDQLLSEGIKLFADAFKTLLNAIEEKRQAVVNNSSNKLVLDDEQATADIFKELDAWSKENKAIRLWARDASLWTNSDETKWMGWLDVPEQVLEKVDELNQFVAEIKQENFTDVVVLGMGGSSLCPEVLAKTFDPVAGFPRLSVLDSTDPEQIVHLENKINLASTLFIVSSKSGSTLEPNIFKEYFFAKVKTLVGDKAGKNFIAITDPGSHLEESAKTAGFRKIFYGVPSIGGRYSALSNFGMVPAALMGIDLKRFLTNAEQMVHDCAPTVLAADNPGVFLGLKLGTAARFGQNKVTLITSPKIGNLGTWLEQLLAESTGKNGKGLIPISNEALGAPAVYGKDRIFIYVRLESNPDAVQDKAINALEIAGQTVVRLKIEDIYYLGAEFFRWEIATAVAGSIIGINPFNQPDVEASKIVARQLTDDFDKTGKLPEVVPLFEDDTFAIYANAKNASDLQNGGVLNSANDYFKAQIKRLSASDYFAFLAFINMNDENAAILDEARLAIRNKFKVATCLEFGPRFLHSTGQAYKGGPNSGVFIQLTSDYKPELAIPNQKFTFGVVIECQARGDFSVLEEKNRRAIRVHIKGDLKLGLQKFKAAVLEALK